MTSYTVNPSAQASADVYAGLNAALKAETQLTAYRAYLENNLFAHLSGPVGSAAPFHKIAPPSNGLKAYSGRYARMGRTGTVGDASTYQREEALRLGSNSLQLDTRRHTSSYTRLQLKEIQAGQSIPAMLVHNEGRWAQELMGNECLLRLTRGAKSRNIRVIGASSFNTLKSANVLDRSQIIRANSYSRQAGVQEIDLRASRKLSNAVTYPTRGNMLIAPEGALLEMKLSAQEINLELAMAQAMNAGQPVALTGGMYNADGTIIQALPARVDDALAQQDWACQALAFVGTNATGASSATPAVASSDSAWTLYGTRYPDSSSTVGSYNFTNDTLINYFGNFLGAPNAISRFEQTFGGTGYTPDEYADIDSGTRWYYIGVYNHVESSAGAGDAGKVGIYRYRSSDVKDNGNRIDFPANSRLSAATTTLGGMLHGSGPFLNKITANHPVGAPVFQINRLGTPVALPVFVGPGALEVSVRDDVQLFHEEHDGKMIHKVISEFTWGHQLCRNIAGDPEKFLVTPCAYNPLGIPWPTIT